MPDAVFAVGRAQIYKLSWSSIQRLVSITVSLFPTFLVRNPYSLSLSLSFDDKSKEEMK